MLQINVLQRQNEETVSFREQQRIILKRASHNIVVRQVLI